MKRLLALFLVLILLIITVNLSISSGKIPTAWAAHPGPIQTSHSIASLSFIPNPFNYPGWTGDPGYTGDDYGAAVASAGDVNGDGYADVVVGAPFYMNGEFNEGRAYAYYGSASGLAITPGWTFESDLAECELGQKAASAGDINGDGYDDVLVGSEYCTSGDPQTDREGRAYLFLGSASGLEASPAWMIEGGVFDESLGWSLASAGDVNGDGYNDVIVGAPWASYPEDHEGRAYVFYGSASGLAQTADWIGESNLAWTGFGDWVDSAGDVNGDGFDDVIVGHPGWSNPEDSEGRAYVFLGSATGLADTPAWTYENNHALSELGFSVAGVGDVNGDGYDDVMAGGGKYLNPEPWEGVAYLFLGSATGPSANPIWSREGNQDYAQYGWAIAPAGDVNDDGYADVLIGAPWFTQKEDAEGVVFLHYGSPGGNLSATVFSKGAGEAEARLGWAVSSAGDVNGDGVDDIIVGARNYGSENAGRVFVYYGIADLAAQALLPLITR